WRHRRRTQQRLQQPTGPGIDVESNHGRARPDLLATPRQYRPALGSVAQAPPRPPEPDARLGLDGWSGRGPAVRHARTGQQAPHRVPSERDAGYDGAEPGLYL